MCSKAGLSRAPREPQKVASGERRRHPRWWEYVAVALVLIVGMLSGLLAKRYGIGGLAILLVPALVVIGAATGQLPFRRRKDLSPEERKRAFVALWITVIVYLLAFVIAYLLAESGPRPTIFHRILCPGTP